MNIGGVSIDASGNTAVEIKATSQDAVLEKITSIGGSTTSASTNDGLIHARIPIDKVEDLAAMDSVKYVGTGSAATRGGFDSSSQLKAPKPPMRPPYIFRGPVGGATTPDANE